MLSVLLLDPYFGTRRNVPCLESIPLLLHMNNQSSKIWKGIRALEEQQKALACQLGKPLLKSSFSRAYLWSEEDRGLSIRRRRVISQLINGALWSPIGKRKK